MRISRDKISLQQVKDYAEILRECGARKDLLQGRLAHDQLCAFGYNEKNTFLGNVLVQMYGNCGNVEDARKAFDQVRKKNTISWNIMLTALLHNGCREEALTLFERMPNPDLIASNTMISAYAQQGQLREAKDLFDRLSNRNVVSWTTMVSGYTHQGHFLDAREMFDTMPDRNVVSWNAMISAYAQAGDGKNAVELFRFMDLDGIQPDRITLTSLLDACGSLGVVELGRILESCILETGLLLDVIDSMLICMYGKCGSVEDASRVFHSLTDRNIVTWNVMITMFAHNRHYEAAEAVFERMPERDIVSWNSIVSFFMQVGDLETVENMFETMPQRNIVTWTSIVATCGQNGHLQKARNVFNVMPERNIVSWNSMISSFAQNQHCLEALKLFRSMDLEGVVADNVTFVNVVYACAGIQALADGIMIYEEINHSTFHSDVVLGTALINMFSKCKRITEAFHVFNKMPKRAVMTWNCMISAYSLNGEIKQARKVFDGMAQRNTVTWTILLTAYASAGDIIEARNTFDGMPEPEIVTWNAMMTAYAQNGQGKNAVKLFAVMDLQGLQPDKVTFVVLLCASANSTILQLEARNILAGVYDKGLELDVCIGMYNMYAKCGNIVDARSLFEKMLPKHDIVSWTLMITAYARHSQGENAIQLWQLMYLEGLQAGEIAFMSIISACSHAGLANYGRYFFLAIVETTSMPPTYDHYLCMIDLLGRVGQLGKAEELLENMPYQPNVIAWRTLLSACRTHHDVHRGARAAAHANELDPNSSASYALLSNIHAATRRN